MGPSDADAPAPNSRTEASTESEYYRNSMLGRARRRVMTDMSYEDWSDVFHRTKHHIAFIFTAYFVMIKFMDFGLVNLRRDIVRRPLFPSNSRFWDLRTGAPKNRVDPIRNPK